MFPGVGGAVIGGLEAGSALLKNKDGLYKNKAAEALDVLNPVTAVSRLATGVGQIFSGEQLDPTGELAMKKALKEQKTRENQELIFGQVGREDTAQLGQYKRGAKAVGTKAIEIEGGEPHFSKKVNGQRMLKSFSPNGPSHEAGGIPTIAAEGDAIVTAKGAKGAQAVAAHAAGNHQLVEKLIKQMPEDKNKPTYGGGNRSAKAKAKTKAAALTPAQLAVQAQQRTLNSNGYQLTPDGKIGPHSQAAMNDFGGMNAPLLFKNTLSDQVKANAALPATLEKTSLATGGYTPSATRLSKATSAAQGALQGSASIYNLGQGLFGNVEKTARRTYTPELQQYEDLSAPQRQASRQGMNQQVANSRNLSAGSAGNMRANAGQAYAENVQRQGAIDSQESGRRLAINGQNAQTRNTAQAANIEMNDRADNLDLQNQAKKSEALAKGLEGISGLASQGLLQKNTLAKESLDRNMLGQAYKNFTYTSEQNVELRKQLEAKLAPAVVIDPLTNLPKKKKGARFIKMKNC